MSPFNNEAGNSFESDIEDALTKVEPKLKIMVSEASRNVFNHDLFFEDLSDLKDLIRNIAEYSKKASSNDWTFVRAQLMSLTIDFFLDPLIKHESTDYVGPLKQNGLSTASDLCNEEWKELGEMIDAVIGDNDARIAALLAANASPAANPSVASNQAIANSSNPIKAKTKPAIWAVSSRSVNPEEHTRSLAMTHRMGTGYRSLMDNLMRMRGGQLMASTESKLNPAESAAAKPGEAKKPADARGVDKDGKGTSKTDPKAKEGKGEGAR